MIFLRKATDGRLQIVSLGYESACKKKSEAETVSAFGEVWAQHKKKKQTQNKTINHYIWIIK